MAAGSTRSPLALMVGLGMGYFGPDDVVVWAQQRIASVDDPPAALTELSSAASAGVTDMMSLLRQLAGTPGLRQETEVTLAFLHQLYTEKRVDLGQATEAVFRLAQEGDMSADERSVAYYLNQGLGTPEDTEARFIALTQPHWERIEGPSGS